jgi:hypothetical protein
LINKFLLSDAFEQRKDGGETNNDRGINENFRPAEKYFISLLIFITIFTRI